MTRHPHGIRDCPKSFRMAEGKTSRAPKLFNDLASEGGLGARARVGSGTEAAGSDGPSGMIRSGPGNPVAEPAAVNSRCAPKSPIPPGHAKRSRRFARPSPRSVGGKGRPGDRGQPRVVQVPDVRLAHCGAGCGRAPHNRVSPDASHIRRDRGTPRSQGEPAPGAGAAMPADAWRDGP
jgi:hypothetical protein